LMQAVKTNPNDSKTYYYIGCFLYDKKRHNDAAEMWKKSIKLDGGFATAHRNMALCCANKKNDYESAKAYLERAFSLDKSDVRVFYELCELYKKIGTPLKVQLKNLEDNITLVEERDDLTIIYAEVQNGLNMHEDALNVILSRKFHPWEGGEGKVPTQHIEARVGLAQQSLSKGDSKTAIEHLENAKIYFENFGEGKLTLAKENNIDYYLGKAYENIDKDKSLYYYQKASLGTQEPSSAIYYNDQPPHMIYYQGCAFRELGDMKNARQCFEKMIAYGEKNIDVLQTIDYFAVSLPDFLVFDSDLNENNKVHCHYMMALGNLGLCEIENAKRHFDAVLALFPNHYGARKISLDI
jgi:Flp pilus assembly protein TadD, contains TPR repeats